VIRCVLVDGGLEPGDLDGIEVRTVAGPLDPGPWAAHEVLVVSVDDDRMAEAGVLGLHRLLATDPAATAAAVAELCAELDRS